MIPIIQLQRLCPHSLENLGGLYLNINHIESLVPFMRTINGERCYYTQVVMISGEKYTTPFGVEEITDMIFARNNNR